MELRKCPPLPPIIKINASGEKAGAKLRPDYCTNFCPRATVGAGFVPDHVPENPRIGILIAKPEKDDVVNFESATAAQGRFLFNVLLAEAGLARADVLVAHVLRCSSWHYPTGADAKRAENACRNFDGYIGNSGHVVKGPPSLEAWAPNIFIPTFEVSKMMEIGAFYALALEDIKKAIRFANTGYRPLVLLGAEAAFFLAPWLEGKGGIRNWRGHWWEGDWRYQVDERKAKGLNMFIPVEPTYRRRPGPKAPVKPTIKLKKAFVQTSLFPIDTEPST